MKINLITDNKENLLNYTNIDYTDDINNYVDDAETEEIRAIDIIQYFPGNESPNIINNWIKKLKHGGKLIIGTIDLIEVAKGVAFYKLNIDDACLFLYGDRHIHKTSFTVNQIAEYLESKGLKIIKKRVVDYRCIVEAIRP